MTGWLGPDEWEAVRLSLSVAAWATALSLPPGLWVAHLLARRRFVGHGLLNVLVHLPLVLPPVVTGYVLLILFGRQGALGGWLYDTFGITLAFRWTGAVLAAAIMAFPLMVRALRLSIEAVDPGLYEAARSLGASRAALFRRITLPLILPGVIVGLVLTFAKALGEFGATITFVGNIAGETRTLPSAIYTLLQVPGGDGPAVRLVLVSVVIAVLAVALSEVLARRAGGQK